MIDFFLFGRPYREWHPWIFFLLRLFVGMTMLTHGLPKLMGFAELSHAFPDPLGIGSVASLVLALLAEVGCSLLLIIGAFTRLASGVLIINMLIAAFAVHGGDPFQAKELALLYLVLYLAVFFAGGERFSLDYLLFHKIRKNTYTVQELGESA